MTSRRIRAKVTGRVQGVGFRMWTQKTAVALGLRGWVRNLKDGSVETVIEGDEAIVEQMIQKLHEGPRVSKVESVEVIPEFIDTSFASFSIL